MTRDIQLQRHYPYPPEVLWHAFATSDALAQWLMPNDFEPRVGHRFVFRTQPAPGFDGIVRCEVLEIAAPRSLSFSWSGGGIDTTVRIELRPEGGGTALTLSQTGFAGLRGTVLSYMLANGWSGMLTRKLPRVAAMVASSSASAQVPAGCDGDTTAWWRWFNRAFRRTALIPAFALSATAAASSQVTQTAVTPLKDLASAMYAPMSKNLLAAAAAMPEDRYDFRVTPDVRSFGQMIAHVAGSQFLYCSTAAGTRLEPSMLARLGVVRPYSEAPSGNQLRMSKADVVALLRDGVGYCRIAHDKVLEGNILEQVKLGGQNVSRLQAFLENAAHNNHHYGNLVAYLRLNGVVPPSSVAEAAQPVSQEIRGPRLALTRVTILVRDQDEALQFYTEKLGMEKRLDQAFAGAYAKPAGGAPLRWVTVGPAGQKDIEIVLQKPDRALHGDRVDEMTSQIGRGPTWAFATDNCERAYEELRRRGVRFLMPPQKQPWGTQAIFEDLYGNSFALVEAPR